MNTNMLPKYININSLTRIYRYTGVPAMRNSVKMVVLYCVTGMT